MCGITPHLARTGMRKYTESCTRCVFCACVISWICAERREINRQQQQHIMTEPERGLGANQCPACTLQLPSRQSLRRHWKTWHKGRDATELEAYFRQYDLQGRHHVCPTSTWGKAFTRACNLKRHQKEVQMVQDLKRKPRFQCPIPGCEVPPFYLMTELMKHCEQLHSDEIGEIYKHTRYDIQ